MTYKDKIDVGSYLTVVSDNPLNSGFYRSQSVLVIGITPSGDPIVKDEGTGHVTSLYRSFLKLETRRKEANRIVYDGDDDEYNRLKRLGL